MGMLRIKNLVLGLISTCSMVLIWGCAGDDTTKSIAFGRPESIILVGASDMLASGKVIDSFENNYARYYPVMPQPEPLFDIRKVDVEAFNEGLMKYRTIFLLVDLSQPGNMLELMKKILNKETFEKVKNKTGSQILRLQDLWINDQWVVVVTGNNASELAENVAKSSQKLIPELNQRETEKYRSMLFIGGRAENSETALEKDFKLKMKIPHNYTIEKQDPKNQFIWIRYVADNSITNLLVRAFPVADSTGLTPENFKRLRNAVTKQYISVPGKNIYMTIHDDVPTPEFSKTTFAGLEALEARGTYKMVGDFMGGPFLSYLVQDKQNNRVLLIDTYVYAPAGQKESAGDNKKISEEYKRPYVRQMESFVTDCKVL
jgi:hypothetical protein